MEGVDIIDIDTNNKIIKLAIPKDSYSYHKDGVRVHNADEFAKI